MGFKFDIYNDIPLETRRKYQLVGTPDWIWDRIVSNIGVFYGHTYLDPCVGRGQGIKALLKAGVKEEQITACDILEANISYCRAIWPRVNYKCCDLMFLDGKYNYVVGVPPWVRKLPEMLLHLESLTLNKCVLLAPFFYGNRSYRKVEAIVAGFHVNDFDDLLKFALAGSQYFGVPCIYEFSHVGAGFDFILRHWIFGNSLENYFVFDKKDSVPDNLVLYSGQEFFLPINPTWFLPYVYGGFTKKDVSKMSILGVMKSGNCYGLVYDSKEALGKAKDFYQSIVVKQVLVCGQNFGWAHLRAV